MGKHGFTDYGVPVGLLRNDMKTFILEHPRASRPVLVREAVKLLKDGLFEKYETEFLGYIAENAISQAENSIAGDGINPITRVSARTKTPAQKAAAKQSRAENDKLIAKEFETAIVQRTIAALAADSTEHEVWALGGAYRRLGKEGSQKLIWSTQRAALEKLGIQEV